MYLLAGRPIQDSKAHSDRRVLPRTWYMCSFHTSCTGYNGLDTHGRHMSGTLSRHPGTMPCHNRRRHIHGRFSYKYYIPCLAGMILVLVCITRQNNLIKPRYCACNTPRGSSRTDAAGIVSKHQHAGAVGQHSGIMIIHLAVAPGAHPHEILGVAPVVVPLHQLQPAFCHLPVTVGLESSFADRARVFHARMARVA